MENVREVLTEIAEKLNSVIRAHGVLKNGAPWRGVEVRSAVLSPRAVQPGAIDEQAFTVQGVEEGSLCAAFKPSAQDGLTLISAGVPHAHTITITFANSGKEPVTPKADEEYQILLIRR